MNFLGRLLLGLLLAGVCARAADQTINFNNNNLGSPRLVTFDFPEIGSLKLAPVRNGFFPEGASYVAQLFRVLPDGSEIPIGAPANFRPANTTQPGTWSGGTRTAEGVPQGTPLQLRVKAWDNSQPTTFELARQMGKLTGASAVFSFQDPMNSPPGATDNFMVNFQGFVLSVPEPGTMALGLLGSLFVLWLPRKR